MVTRRNGFADPYADVGTDPLLIINRLCELRFAEPFCCVNINDCAFRLYSFKDGSNVLEYTAIYGAERPIALYDALLDQTYICEEYSSSLERHAISAVSNTTGTFPSESRESLRRRISEKEFKDTFTGEHGNEKD